MAFGKETPITKAMRALEEAAIAQDLSAEKVAGLRAGLLDGRLLKHATNPKEIAALADEINEASQVLDQYRRSLESDLERRGNFITMLTECIVQQENTMNQTTNILQDCLQQLARAEELKNQIKSQYPSLPAADRPQAGTLPATGAGSSAAFTSTGVGQQAPPYGSFLPHQHHQHQQGGPATTAEEPPVDDEDDVILDASATNPYKKQKLYSSTPAPAATSPPSSSVPSYSTLQPPVAPSYAPLSAPANLNGGAPPPPAHHVLLGQGAPLQPLPYAAPPPALHQWMPSPQQQQHHQQQPQLHHSHHHLSQPFADYDYGPPPH
jgi:uncharacterized membrane-anchored protein YhcB (DUF1043 family)